MMMIQQKFTNRIEIEGGGSRKLKKIKDEKKSDLVY